MFLTAELVLVSVKLWYEMISQNNSRGAVLSFRTVYHTVTCVEEMSVFGISNI